MKNGNNLLIYKECKKHQEICSNNKYKWQEIKLKLSHILHGSFSEACPTGSFTVSAMFISTIYYLCNKIPRCYWLRHQILSNINQLQPS